MARTLRVEYAGASYHVTVRGNARADIFRDAKDRRILYGRLAESVPEHGVRLYLFCLMSNHFHLVLETPRGNLGRFMQAVLTGYAVCYNLRHRRHGHLTQGRYGARLVAGDDYLLRLSRYVHVNPVKVRGQVERPLAQREAYLRDHEWSSYRSYIGLAPRLAWVDYAPMLALAGGREGERPERYRAFVEVGVAEEDEGFRQAMSLSPHGIGDEAFRESVDAHYAALVSERRHPEDVAFRKEVVTRPTAAAVIAAVASAAGTTPEGLKTRRRNWVWKGIAARLLVMRAGLTRRDAARWLGLHAGSAVGYQIEQAARKLDADTQLARRVARLEMAWSRRP
jgi:putative transposase